MPAPNVITADKLVRLIGTPACPTLIDLGPSSRRILLPGSIVRTAATVAEWAALLPRRAVVVIDENGGPSAHGVAAWLRADGLDADILEGGISAWRDADRPLIVIDHLPARDRDGCTLWITRTRPKVDRIACPWLIRRFVDPHARFLFVPPPEVLSVAERLGAEPFDVQADGVMWSHHAERCTFDVMLEAFGLSALAPLGYLAGIVRGADTNRLDLVPEAAGLLAVSLGLSRMHADDHLQLEAGMLIYDALYRWCRDARDETHDWTSHKAPRTELPA